MVRRSLILTATLVAALLAILDDPGARATATDASPEAIPPPPAQERQIGGVGITVFEEAHFRGRNATFRDTVRTLRSFGLNDRIRSLRVAPGEMWEGCEHDDFRGRCQVFSGEEYDLRSVGWDNMLSSLRPVRGPYPPPTPPVSRGGLTLYSAAFFRGDARTLDTEISDLRQIGFDNRAASVRVVSGSWELCEDPYFRDCRRVDADWPNLANLGLARRVSSVRPAGWGPNPPPSWRPRRLVLYDGKGYRGRSWTIDGSQEWAAGAGQAQSLRTLSGTWEVCAGRNWNPPCLRFAQDVPDLGAYGFNNRIVSVRPVE